MNFLRKIISKIKYYFSRERCYNKREDEGLASFCCCSGLVGGDKESEYLQYECLDCKYLVTYEGGVKDDKEDRGV